MNRRTYLKKVMAASAGLAALPSWANGWTTAVIGGGSSFSVDEQHLLAGVADTIIPAGNSIGALSVGVDKFLQKLFDNCYEKEVRENIKLQLINLESGARSNYGKSFSECDQIQRQDLLLMRAGSENKAEKDFFDLVKSETIRGFSTSREVMLDYLKYKVVPGHYYGCIDVNS